MLLDSMAFMHRSWALGLSLVCGALATIWALQCLTNGDKK